MSTVTALGSDAAPSGAATPSTTARRPRGSLSRQNVLVAGLDLVDREGLEALSMRRLAAHLDVETMSLYKRVANKDDLLAGIAQLIWGEVAAAAPPSDDWGDWLRTLANAVRAALRDHPNAIPLLVGIEVLPIDMLEVIATQLERATPGWPTRDNAVSAICAVTAYALGCAFAECSYCNPAATDDPITAERQRLRRIARALPPDTPDRLIDTALAVCGNDTTDMFTKGLDLITRGSHRDCR
jgi:TetR/AcrR family tetracycline transcriptional repressor